jgi:hypothetical protein
MPLKRITTEDKSQVTAEQVRNFLKRESPDLLIFLDDMREAFGDIQVTKTRGSWATGS